MYNLSTYNSDMQPKDVCRQPTSIRQFGYAIVAALSGAQLSLSAGIDSGAMNPILSRHLLRLALLVGTIAIFASQPAFAQQAATPAVHAITDADLAAFFDPLMQDQLSRLKIAGAVAVVVKNGGILFARGYGYADVESRRPMTADDTLVRPGSISKLFTGIAVMQLVEQGKLDLDRDVNDYLDFHIPTPAGGVPVTLRRLMTHRAGFEEHAKDIFSADPSPEPLGRWLARSLPRRLFPAGDVPAYSNYGIGLAGYVVERVAGEPFADYVAGHILRPLRMMQSTFRQPLPDVLAPRMAKSYRRSDQAAWPFFETITPSPAGALSTTGLDMGRFMLALLRGGFLDGARLLNEQSLARMMAPEIASQTGNMGLVFLETRIAGTRLVGHQGGTMSFHSSLLLSPENDLGIFVCYDGAAAEMALGHVLERFAHRYLPAQPPAGGLTEARPQDADAVAGVYQTSRRADSTIVRLSALTSQILVRTAQAGTLTMYGGPFGAGESFHSVGEGRFRGPKGNEAAFDEPAGQPMRLNYGAPVVQWQRVPLYLDFRLLAYAVIASAGIAVLTLVAWPIAAILRWRQGRRWSECAIARRCHLAVRLVLALQVVVIAATAVLFIAATANPTILSNALDPVLAVLYACAWLGVLGGFGSPWVLLWVAWRFWRKRIGGWWTVVHHTLIAASGVTLAWFFLVSHIAGTTLNY